MLIICDLCDKDITSTPRHVCDRADIRAYVTRLVDDNRAAERDLDDIRNGVYKLLQSLPNISGTEEVVVRTDWLRRLWSAAACQWHEAKTADSFLVSWLATHRILSRAFDLFRSENRRQKVTMRDKLQSLKDACVQAQKVLGYEDSKLDLGSDDVVRLCRDES